MKKKRLSRSGFINPRVLFGFVLGSLGVLLALLAFGMSSGASALAQGPKANQGSDGTLPALAAAISPDAKIAPEVLADTAGGQSASIVVLLADQADVSAAYAMKDQDARGWFVYNTLTQHAARTQLGLKTFLTARGAGYQSFWAANMIVTSADRALVDSLAARADVARIDSNKPARWVEDPEIAKFGTDPDSDTPNAAEWGVLNVNAPAVWAMGFTGQGMVLGDLDTGMRWTHNALKPKYRGWNGVIADHNFNWHDAIHSGGGTCGANSVVPCDDFGHGTHTAGTTVGDDGSGNQVGVAPGAKWIGCRNMDQGNGTPATYTECFQFMIAPTDLAGNNANPALRPHVLNNSWGCPASEGCVTRAELETIVNNTQAAGIFVEASAGNSGPGCSSVTDAPAIYSATFSTGAIDISNGLAGFSSRGPSTFYTPNLLKPNISAPGVNVRSTLRSSDTSYGNMSGTSMAGPHVVGVVALLWSARPQLVRDIAATKTILQNTANPGVVVSAQTCGGISSTQIPNNSFGYGRVDALAAVNSVATSTPTPTSTPAATPTPTPPITPTPTPTPPATPSPTATHTPTPTPPATPSPSATHTPTPTPPATPSPSATHTPTPTPPATPSPSATHTPTPTPPATPSPTATVPPTPTPTPSSPTPTPSGTPLPTPSEPPRIDLSITIDDSPDPVQVGQNLTYTITVQNGSVADAPGVQMSDTLPVSVNLVSVTPSQGSCFGTVFCDLGTIPIFANATVIVVVTPTVAGPLSNTASAPYSVDPFPQNNSATASTTVLPATTPTPTATPTPTPASQAVNLSTRMQVQTGGNVGIGGFIITGSPSARSSGPSGVPKHVLLRAIGPSLTPPGVPDALADPVLELHGPDGFVTITNDNWRDDPEQEALIIASGIPPTNDLESAIDATLTPGAYTAIVRGKNNTSGVALVEVYDLNQAVPAQLANMSTRALVNTGDDIVIAGFVLGNHNGDDRIIVRGMGPSLTAEGVPNALADPVLELRDRNGALLVSNNDWQDNAPQAAEIIAAGLAPNNPLESGIAATLAPGLYTALLAGLNNGAGVGLVEVYDLGSP
jgi:uncharacterized repeat protein (TIGR01451 family)